MDAEAKHAALRRAADPAERLDAAAALLASVSVSASSVPAALRAAYVSAALREALKACGSKASPPRAWAVLASALGSPDAPAGAAPPASLVRSLASALGRGEIGGKPGGGTKRAAGGTAAGPAVRGSSGSDEMDVLAREGARVLRLLRTKFAAALAPPPLEHLIDLLQAAVERAEAEAAAADAPGVPPSSRAPGSLPPSLAEHLSALLTEACGLLAHSAQRHGAPKKAWAAVVPRLPLLAARVARAAQAQRRAVGGPSHASVALARAVEALVSALCAVALDDAHLDAVLEDADARWVAFAGRKGEGSEGSDGGASGAGRDSAGARPTDAKGGTFQSSYASQLLGALLAVGTEEPTLAPCAAAVAEKVLARHAARLDGLDGVWGGPAAGVMVNLDVSESASSTAARGAQDGTTAADGSASQPLPAGHDGEDLADQQRSHRAAAHGRQRQSLGTLARVRARAPLDLALCLGLVARAAEGLQDAMAGRVAAGGSDGTVTPSGGAAPATPEPARKRRKGAAAAAPPASPETFPPAAVGAHLRVLAAALDAIAALDLYRPALDRAGLQLECLRRAAQLAQGVGRASIADASRSGTLAAEVLLVLAAATRADPRSLETGRIATTGRSERRAAWTALTALAPRAPMAGVQLAVAKLRASADLRELPGYLEDAAGALRADAGDPDRAGAAASLARPEVAAAVASAVAAAPGGQAPALARWAAATSAKLADLPVGLPRAAAAALLRATLRALPLSLGTAARVAAEALASIRGTAQACRDAFARGDADLAPMLEAYLAARALASRCAKAHPGVPSAEASLRGGTGGGLPSGIGTDAGGEGCGRILPVDLPTDPFEALKLAGAPLEALPPPGSAARVPVDAPAQLRALALRTLAAEATLAHEAACEAETRPRETGGELGEAEDLARWDGEGGKKGKRKGKGTKRLAFPESAASRAASARAASSVDALSSVLLDELRSDPDPSGVSRAAAAEALDEAAEALRGRLRGSAARALAAAALLEAARADRVLRSAEVSSRVARPARPSVEAGLRSASPCGDMAAADGIQALLYSNATSDADGAPEAVLAAASARSTLALACLRAVQHSTLPTAGAYAAAVAGALGEALASDPGSASEGAREALLTCSRSADGATVRAAALSGSIVELSQRLEKRAGSGPSLWRSAGPLDASVAPVLAVVALLRAARRAPSPSEAGAAVAAFVVTALSALEQGELGAAAGCLALALEASRAADGALGRSAVEPSRGIFSSPLPAEAIPALVAVGEALEGEAGDGLAHAAALVEPLAALVGRACLCLAVQHATEPATFVAPLGAPSPFASRASAALVREAAGKGALASAVAGDGHRRGVDVNTLSAGGVVIARTVAEAARRSAALLFEGLGVAAAGGTLPVWTARRAACVATAAVAVSEGRLDDLAAPPDVRAALPPAAAAAAELLFAARRTFEGVSGSPAEDAAEALAAAVAVLGASPVVQDDPLAGVNALGLALAPISEGCDALDLGNGIEKPSAPHPPLAARVAPAVLPPVSEAAPRSRGRPALAAALGALAAALDAAGPGAKRAAMGLALDALTGSDGRLSPVAAAELLALAAHGAGGGPPVARDARGLAAVALSWAAALAGGPAADVASLPISVAASEPSPSGLAVHPPARRIAQAIVERAKRDEEGRDGGRRWAVGPSLRAVAEGSGDLNPLRRVWVLATLLAALRGARQAGSRRSAWSVQVVMTTVDACRAAAELAARGAGALDGSISLRPSIEVALASLAREAAATLAVVLEAGSGGLLPAMAACASAARAAVGAALAVGSLGRAGLAARSAVDSAACEAVEALAHAAAEAPKDKAGRGHRAAALGPLLADVVRIDALAARRVRSGDARGLVELSARLRPAALAAYGVMSREDLQFVYRLLGSDGSATDSLETLKAEHGREYKFAGKI